MPGNFDILKYVIDQIISHLFGQQAANGPSLRQSLLKEIFDKLLHPDQPKLVVQSYYDKLSVFVSMAVVLIVVELCVRGMRAVKNDDYSEEGRQFGFSVLFLFIAVPILPGFLGGTQSFFDYLGEWFAKLFVDVNNIDGFINQLLALSGNGKLDLALSTFQVILLIFFAAWVFITPILLWLSSILLVIGMSLRWMGEFGDGVFGFTVRISLYAVTGNFIMLFVTALIVGAGKMFYASNPFGLAMTNTFALFAAFSTIAILFARTKTQVDTAVSAAVEATATLRDKVGGKSPQTVEGKSQDQIKTATETHRKHSRGTEADRDDDVVSTRGRKSNPAKNTSSTESPEGSSEATNGQPAGRPSTPRRYATDSHRSRTRLTDENEHIQSPSSKRNQEALESARHDKPNAGQAQDNGQKPAGSTPASDRPVHRPQRDVAQPPISATPVAKDSGRASSQPQSRPGSPGGNVQARPDTSQPAQPRPPRSNTTPPASTTRQPPAQSRPTQHPRNPTDSTKPPEGR